MNFLVRLHSSRFHSYREARSWSDVKLVCALPPLTAARYPPRWLVPVRVPAAGWSLAQRPE